MQSEPRQTETCPSCGHKVYVVDALPATDDEQGWHRLADQHATTCEVIRLRGRQIVDGRPPRGE